MNGAIYFSEAASLALHATGVLAGAGDDPITAGRMAEALGASEAHLAKVLGRLSKAGLVSATRGPHGGFRLSVDATEVTLRDVYEAIEGNLEIQHCLSGLPVCDKPSCALSSLFEKVSTEIVEGLAAITLHDFSFSSETLPVR
ncbi:Rrf2 family transcriptional regulator [bacterium]|jgi:Rrf2 family protein|nr:Rrf2 family transcriptional regulator [bacterium]